jgi:hypothetical protein
MRQSCPPCKSNRERSDQAIENAISGLGKECHGAAFDPLLVSRPPGALPVADVSGHSICIVVGALNTQSWIVSGNGKKRYLNGGDSGGTLLIRSPRAVGCASGRFSRRPVERFEHKLGVRGQLDDHPHGRSSSPTYRLFDQRSI